MRQSKSFSSGKNGLFKNNRNLKIRIISFVLIFATIGLLTLLVSRAASEVISLEAESGQLSGIDTPLSDASASGGKYIKFNGTNSPDPSESITIVAAGDVGHDSGTSGQAATGNLIRSINPDYVLMLGDGAYDDGTLSQYQTLYDPYWGSFKAITRPVPGNHEQNDDDNGYDAYFGAGYHNYTWTVGNWRFIGLDTNDGDSTGLAFLNGVPNDKPCSIVYFHHPWHSSGSSYHGGISGVKSLHTAARARNVDLILTGHEHNMELFGKTNANKIADASGYRPIVSGAGGRSLRGFSTLDPLSEIRINNTHGVLKLELKSASYSGQFSQVNGTNTPITESTCNPKT